MSKQRNKLLRRLVEGKRIGSVMAFSNDMSADEATDVINVEYEWFYSSFRKIHPRVERAVFCLYPIEVGWINDDFANDISRAHFMFSIKRIL